MEQSFYLFSVEAYISGNLKEWNSWKKKTKERDKDRSKEMPGKAAGKAGNRKPIQARIETYLELVERKEGTSNNSII